MRLNGVINVVDVGVSGAGGASKLCDGLESLFGVGSYPGAGKWHCPVFLGCCEETYREHNSLSLLMSCSALSELCLYGGGEAGWEGKVLLLVLTEVTTCLGRPCLCVLTAAQLIAASLARSSLISKKLLIMCVLHYSALNILLDAEHLVL